MKENSFIGRATKEEKPVFEKVYTRWRGKIAWSDGLFLLYSLVLLRQYFWIVENNSLAWALSALVAVIFSYFFVATRQFSAEKFGVSFWLVVGLPLLATYLLRAAFPDHSYDVLGYHLMHAERSLRGPLYAIGDFFPSHVPFNPAPDTLTGLSRLLLGFRLGTVINLLALLWAAQVADKILRKFVVRPWLRSVCVLLVITVENFSFEISTYMIDLLALPLMLEATYLVIRADEAENQRANFVHVALLLGASTAFKLTNLAVVLPLAAICAYKMAAQMKWRWKEMAATSVFAIAAFLAPLLPFTIYIFRLTGNPVFPVANGFFQSPYWPTHGGWDDRFGPHGFWETLVWPVLMWFKPERQSELTIYSGRLSLGFIIAFAGLILLRRNTHARLLCLLLIASAFLWSIAGMGYTRYGLNQELLAGVTIVAVIFALLNNASVTSFSWRVALASLFCIALVAQGGQALVYSLRHDWGGRPSLIDGPARYLEEAKLVLRDHSLPSFLKDEERARFKDVQVWFETCPKSTGFEVLLNSRASIIAARQPEYFLTRESRRQFISIVKNSSGQRMFSLCLNDDAPKAKQVIAERGLEVGELTPLEVPFFSPRDRIGMMLIEVRVPQEQEALNRFESMWMKGAFPESVYREEIVALNAPLMMRPGERVDIRFKVKNLGNSTWPAVGTSDFRYQINMGNHWIGAGATVEDSRAVLKADLPAGVETEVTMAVTAPRTPGEYTLEIDMVHEGVTWFKERGARPLLLRVRVAP